MNLGTKKGPSWRSTTTTTSSTTAAATLTTATTAAQQVFSQMSATTKQKQHHDKADLKSKDTIISHRTLLYQVSVGWRLTQIVTQITSYDATASSRVSKNQHCRKWDLNPSQDDHDNNNGDDDGDGNDDAGIKDVLRRCCWLLNVFVHRHLRQDHLRSCLTQLHQDQTGCFWLNLTEAQGRVSTVVVTKAAWNRSKMILKQFLMPWSHGRVSEASTEMAPTTKIETNPVFECRTF